MGVMSRSLRVWLYAALAMALVAATGSKIAIAGSMTVGMQTSQPIGHYEFCRVRPGECVIRPASQQVLVLDDAVWQRLGDVNRAVNRAVKPMNDIDIYGKDEVWTYPDAGVGDCEDYVLEKRRRLADTGISLANLLITVVRKPDGEGHAVLTVRTNRGDFVLDNLSSQVKLWSETGYRFLKRQASYHTGRWVSLVEERNMLVGAVE